MYIQVMHALRSICQFMRIPFVNSAFEKQHFNEVMVPTADSVIVWKGIRINIPMFCSRVCPGNTFFLWAGSTQSLMDRLV